MSENNTNIPPYPPEYSRREKKNNWWVPVLIIFGVLAVIFVSIILLIGYTVSKVSDMSFGTDEEVVIKANSVLYLDFENGLPEYKGENVFEGFGNKKSETLLNVLTAIELAAEDEDILGIYIRPKSNMPLSRAMEVNEALAKFKKSGKFIYSFIEAGDEAAYISCLTSDSIFMPTEGLLEMNGFATTGMFFKGMFEKAGIEFLTLGYEDFKSAGDMFSRRDFSDSSKYQTRVLLEHRYEEFLNQVSTHRKMDKATINNYLNQGLYTTEEVLKAGFIDGINTEYNVKRMIRDNYYDKDTSAEYSDKINLVSAGKYMASNPKSNKKINADNKTIAIIYASGNISSGYADGSPFSDSEGIHSDSFIKDLKKAREDEDVDLIILRIDSPGGSAIASDEMWEEIMLTRKVKPVWASMSSVAASGGYYMSMACDKIYAHPHTITGSIGVILSVPNLSGLAKNLDITFDTLATNPAASFLNGAYPYTEKDIVRLKELSYGIYKRFVSRAAERNKMSFEEMRSKAKGRVWNGNDALAQGLVDELGGFEKVIADAKKEIGIKDDELVLVKEYPRKSDKFEDFIKDLMGDKDEEEMDMSNSNLLQKLGLSKKDLMEYFVALPENLKQNLMHSLNLISLSEKEKVLMTMPELLIIK